MPASATSSGNPCPTETMAVAVAAGDSSTCVNYLSGGNAFTDGIMNYLDSSIYDSTTYVDFAAGGVNLTYTGGQNCGPSNTPASIQILIACNNTSGNSYFTNPYILN